jgi:hypothetical protein
VIEFINPINARSIGDVRVQRQGKTPDSDHPEVLSGLAYNVKVVVAEVLNKFTHKRFVELERLDAEISSAIEKRRENALCYGRAVLRTSSADAEPLHDVVQQLL